MATNILRTYSARDLNITFTHPLIGSISAAGVDGKGIAQIDIRMTQDKTILDLGIDGAVVPSYIPGDLAEIEIKMWQTCTLHQQFLALANAIKAASDAGDVSQVFSGRFLIVNIVDGSSHYLTGVAPKKIPDKSYQKQAQQVSWVFVACSCVNE